MIRHQAIPTIPAIPADDPSVEDGSMRIIEFAVALIALAVAGILALVR
jgi:hypothetical protein